MTTIRCLLEECSYISKHQPGIIQGDRIILYSEWNDYASAAAERLAVSGVARGDRVALYMAEDWRMLVLITAIIRAGAIACPISTRLPRDAVVRQLEQIQCVTIIAYLGDGSQLPGIRVISPDGLLEPPVTAAPVGIRVNVDDAAIIVFTSGTSGQPRPAVLSYGNLYYNARGANVNMRLHSSDRWLLNLPLYHVSGLGILFRSMLAGSSIVVPDTRESLVQAVTRCRPSHISVVPAQLSDLLADAEHVPVNSIKAFLVGGSAVGAALIERCREKGWPLYLTYGMTEMASQITTMPPDAPPAKRATTSGKLLRHRQMTVSGNGEVLVKGPCLFMGYWTTGSIMRPVDDDGWFHTGDVGHVDADGYLSVTGRVDNMFISGGENIQPEEIEAALLQLEGIKKAVVVPRPDAKFGFRPIAFVDCNRLREKNWSKALATTLPGFKIPVQFIMWPENVPSGAGLKLSRTWFIEKASAP